MKSRKNPTHLDHQRHHSPPFHDEAARSKLYPALMPSPPQQGLPQRHLIQWFLYQRKKSPVPLLPPKIGRARHDLLLAGNQHLQLAPRQIAAPPPAAYSLCLQSKGLRPLSGQHRPFWLLSEHSMHQWKLYRQRQCGPTNG